MARSYNPNDYLIYFAGIVVDRGYVSVTISPEAELYSQQVGIDGDTTRSRNNNINWICELVVQQSSPVNQLLSDVYNEGRLGFNGGGVGTFTLVDLVGGTEVVADRAWITQAPDISVGAEVGERTWTIYLEKPSLNFAGLPEV
jgi:hypothetical protein